jgi:hypothetical protein
MDYPDDIDPKPLQGEAVIYVAELWHIPDSI